MNDKKRVYIIGAGAGKDIGMPVGEGLANEIVSLLDYEFRQSEIKHGDKNIYRAIQHHHRQNPEGGYAIGECLGACSRIVDGLPYARSIDDFIHINGGQGAIAFCGKMAIVSAILKAESYSLLSPEAIGARHLLRKHKDESPVWYLLFWKQLVENCSKDEIPDRFSNITLIIFNYDRCVEQFIYMALRSTYGVDSDKAADMISYLNIYHPYGAVGLLPWQQEDGPKMEIGGEPNQIRLLELANGIKTFTEGQEAIANNTRNMGAYLRNSEIVVFLGFHYLDLNMQLLALPQGGGDRTPKVNYYGTAYKRSSYEIEDIERAIDLIGSRPSRSITVGDWACSDIFNVLSTRLSFS